MTMSLCGAVPRDIGFCLFFYPRGKVKYIIIFDRPPPPDAPLKRDCDTIHYIAIFTADINVNHDNEPLWGITTKHTFLLFFPTQESKMKCIIIFEGPLLGPLKGIVTPTTKYQYLQLVSLSIMTMSLCGAVPRDIGFCLFSYPRGKSEIYYNF